jgi:hypothetical protein
LTLEIGVFGQYRVDGLPASGHLNLLHRTQNGARPVRVPQQSRRRSCYLSAEASFWALALRLP